MHVATARFMVCPGEILSLCTMLSDARSLVKLTRPCPSVLRKGEPLDLSVCRGDLETCVNSVVVCSADLIVNHT